jgi:hypothetical protein
MGDHCRSLELAEVNNSRKMLWKVGLSSGVMPRPGSAATMLGAAAIIGLGDLSSALWLWQERTRALEGEAGTGLGLSQVYGFVRQVGGDLRIESRPGAGTAVHLLFPKVAQSIRNGDLEQLSSTGDRGARNKEGCKPPADA